MTTEQLGLLQELLDAPEVIITAQFSEREYMTFAANVGAAYIRRKKMDGTGGYENAPVLVRIDMVPLESLTEEGMKAKMQKCMDRAQEESAC